MDDLAQEVRFVAASDVEALDAARLRALEAELSQRAEALSRALGDAGPAGDELLAALNEQIVRVHELLGVREKRSLLSRILRREA